jgi:HAD superfamily hydrolase (TIGR01549 family)
MLLNSYSDIIWDFDGVILDSDSIREYGFRESLKKFPEDQVELLIEYHKKNGGLSRYNKFRFFFEKILHKKISENDIICLANTFSKIMLKKLTNKKLLIKDSLNFIISNYKTKKMYIASGSDNNELIYLCKELGIFNFFYSIHGSPEHKNNIVKNILKQNQSINKNFVLIGDSINDFEAAKANNIDFYGYNNKELLNTCKTNYITNFNNES